MSTTSAEEQPQPPVEPQVEPDRDNASDDDVAGHVFTGALRDRDQA